MSQSPFYDFRENPSVLQRNQLLEQHYPLVDRIARYGVRERLGDIEDLKSICLDQLIDAIERYDPASGKPFEAYAIAKMKWAMKTGSWAQPLSLNEPTIVGNGERLDSVADKPTAVKRVKNLSSQEQGLIDSVLKELPEKVQVIARWHFLGQELQSVNDVLSTVQDLDRYVNEIVDLIAQVKSGKETWFDTDQMARWRDSELIFDLVMDAIAHLKSKKMAVTLYAVAHHCRFAEGHFWLQPRSLQLIRSHQSMMSLDAAVELAIQQHLADNLEVSVRAIAKTAKVPMSVMKKNTRLMWAIRRAEKQRSLHQFRQQVQSNQDLNKENSQVRERK